MEICLLFLEFSQFLLIQDSRSVGAIAGLALAIVFTWRMFRSPSGPQRRPPKRQAPTTSNSVASPQSNTTLIPAGISLPPEDLRAQNVVDEFFQPVKVSIYHFVKNEYFCSY